MLISQMLGVVANKIVSFAIESYSGPSVVCPSIKLVEGSQLLLLLN